MVDLCFLIKRNGSFLSQNAFIGVKMVPAGNARLRGGSRTRKLVPRVKETLWTWIRGNLLIFSRYPLIFNRTTEVNQWLDFDLESSTDSSLERSDILDPHCLALLSLSSSADKKHGGKDFVASANRFVITASANQNCCGDNFICSNNNMNCYRNNYRCHRNK